MIRAMVLSLFLIFFSAFAYGYTCNAFNGQTGEGFLSVAPTFSVPFSADEGVSLDLVASYGFTPNFDVFADFAQINSAASPSYVFSWIMPRFEFLPGNIIGLQIEGDYGDPWTFSLSPQYHFYLENDLLSLEFNAGASFQASDWTAPKLYGCGGFAWKALSGIVHPFIEVDPSWSAADSLHLDVLAGLWIGIPNTPHQFCVGFKAGDALTDNRSYGIVCWYSASFSLNAPKDK